MTAVQEVKDVSLTFDQLLEWCEGNLCKVGENLRSRKQAYAYRSKAKGFKHLEWLERQLHHELGKKAAENYKRQQKAEAVKRYALKRLRQYVELENNANLVSLFKALLPLLDSEDRNEFDFAEFYTALEQLQLQPYSSWWLDYMKEAGEENMLQAYNDGKYGRMNQIGESLAKLDKAIEAVEEVL